MYRIIRHHHLGIRVLVVITRLVLERAPVELARIGVEARVKPPLKYDTTTCPTVDGMLLGSNSWASVLFDTSASHFFISMLFVRMLGLEYEPLESALSVGFPLDRDCELSFWCSLVCIYYIPDFYVASVACAIDVCTLLL